MNINTTDMAKLETKYRQVLKNMLSLPVCAPSALVYLSVGVLPATAQRDLEILGCLGQLALSDMDDQNVRKIILHNLTFYDDNFGGWSGLARKTAERYGLPDPLQYMQYPWRADRWREHCRQRITVYWEEKLKSELFNEEGDEKTSSLFVDVDNLSLTSPMRIWQQAAMDSNSVKEATPSSWMYSGVYFTREFMYKMKKTKSPNCACEMNVIESLPHFLLECNLYQSVREQYLPKYLMMNKNVTSICDSKKQIIICILDPLSSKLPDCVTSAWSSVRDVYQLSRKFTYRMHLKREKIYNELDGDG